jgi:RNA polymerase sigma factor (sigma-70 family)
MSSESSKTSEWFEQEVQPIEQPLRDYLRRSLPSQADVDDVVQESYIRLLKAKEKRLIRSTKAFLFTIARNVVRDFLHRRARTASIPITETGALPVLEGDESLVEGICRRQELAVLREAIDSLPDRCREVILLRKIKGLSQKEIAELLGIAEHTVEALAVKGVRRCAQYLLDHGVGGERP